MRRISAASKSAKLAELKATDLARFNVEAEKEFQSFLCREIATFGPMEFSEAIREVAFNVNVGVTTAKKYILKHTSRQAHFFFNALGQVDCKQHTEKSQKSDTRGPDDSESRRRR
jgi:hypothetical protein